MADENTNGVLDDTLNNNGTVTPVVPATQDPPEEGLLGGTTESSVTPTSPSGFVSDESKISTQLNSLLASGSPILDLAESRSKEQANRLGLLSSSLAVGAGQKAIVDKAFDIAKAETTPFQAADLSAQGAAQDLTLDTQQQQGRLDIENIQQTGANTRLAQELANTIEDTKLRVAAEDRGAFAETTGKINQQTITAIADINIQPDNVLSAEDKATAIENIKTQAAANIDYIASLYDVVIDWGTE